LKTYEIVFVLDERHHRDGGEEFVGSVSDQVEKLGGRIIEKNPMGRRQFARPIKKQTAGVYWDFIIELDPSKVNAFKDAYRLDNTVFRCAVLVDNRPESVK